MTRTRARTAVVEVSSEELADAVGISYRQVDYWVRSGLLRTAAPVEGSGRSRRFTPAEVKVARVVATLRRLGVGAPAEGDGLLRAVAEAVREGRPAVEVGRVLVEVDDLTVRICAPYRARHG